MRAPGLGQAALKAETQAVREAVAKSREMGGFVRITGAWHSTQHGCVP